MKHEPVAVVRSCLAQAGVQSALPAGKIKRIRARLAACGYSGAQVVGVPQVMTAVQCRQNLRRCLLVTEASFRSQGRAFEQVQVHEALLDLDSVGL